MFGAWKHILKEISNMLGAYFDGFLMRFTTKDYTTIWTRLEVGIAMGCIVSPIPFVLAMQMLLKVTERKADIVHLGGGCQMPPLKRSWTALQYHIRRIYNSQGIKIDG